MQWKVALVVLGVPGVMIPVLAGCKTGGSGGQETALTAYGDGKTVSIEGDAAASMIEALQAAGITDTTGMVGAMNLAVDAIACSRVVHPTAKAKCTLTTAEVTRSAPADASETLHGLLLANEGGVSPATVGAANTAARSVSCSRPVYPNAKGSCSFVVGGGQNPDNPDEPVTPAEPKYEDVSFVGAEASSLISALTKSGLKAEMLSHMKSRVRADLVTCSAAVVAQPKPDCSITPEGGGAALKAPTTAAKSIYQILVAHGATLPLAVVGSTRADAVAVECVFGSPPTAPTCAFKVHGLPDTQKYKTVTVKPQDATQLMKALSASGITDDSGLVGAQNLKAAKVECSAPVVPNAKPSCLVTKAAGEAAKKAPVAAAKSLHRIILAAGGLLETGLVGSAQSEAVDIACSRPVVPNPVAGCTLKVRVK